MTSQAFFHVIRNFAAPGGIVGVVISRDVRWLLVVGLMGMGGSYGVES